MYGRLHTSKILSQNYRKTCTHRYKHTHTHTHTHTCSVTSAVRDRDLRLTVVVIVSIFVVDGAILTALVVVVAAVAADLYTDLVC